MCDGVFYHSPQVRTPSPIRPYILQELYYNTLTPAKFGGRVDSIGRVVSSFRQPRVSNFSGTYIACSQYYIVSRPMEYFVVHNSCMRKPIETEAKPPYIYLHEVSVDERWSSAAAYLRAHLCLHFKSPRPSPVSPPPPPILHRRRVS